MIADTYLVEYPSQIPDKGTHVQVVTFPQLVSLFSFFDSADGEPTQDALSCILLGGYWDVTILATYNNNTKEVY